MKTKEFDLQEKRKKQNKFAKKLRVFRKNPWFLATYSQIAERTVNTL